MSKLTEKIDVPRNVRKNAAMCPQVVEIYDDHVSCIGGKGGSWFYKDFTGVSVQAASVACAFAGVVFLNAVSGANNIKVGASMLQDRNRINFASGMFSYAPANEFASSLARKIRKAMEDYKSRPQESGTTVVKAELSPADEIKKFKELLDMGVITQEEFDRKKKELLGF